jgi:flagellar basal-body rod modification protein FlgD
MAISSVDTSAVKAISVEDIRKQASVSTPASTAPKTAQELGKDDFLKLLTIQLKNQDPMEPIKNEAFIAQLAQFSSLEQLQNINTTLSNGNQNGTAGQSATLAALNNHTAVSFIGRQVEIQADTVSLPDSGSASIPFRLEGTADRVSAEITDAQGTHVRTITLRPSGLQGAMLWDGKTDDGVRAQPGTYRVSVTAQAGADPVGASSVFTREVTGVRMRPGAEPLLVFPDGTAPVSSASGIFTGR